MMDQLGFLEYRSYNASVLEHRDSMLFTLDTRAERLPGLVCGLQNAARKNCSYAILRNKQCDFIFVDHNS